MSGRSTTERVEEYISKWQSRCYKNGIPDELPRKLQDSGRAPSYRAIAEAILKNDMQLATIGGCRKQSRLADIILAEHNKKGNQICLI